METCPKCGISGAQTICTEGKHYARIDCPICKRWIKWVAKPDNEDERRETTKCNVKLDYCRICGRLKEELGDNETIEAHHLTPLIEGGKDELDNLLVACTACHRIMHYQRLYLNKHLRKYYDRK